MLKNGEGLGNKLGWATHGVMPRLVALGHICAAVAFILPSVAFAGTHPLVEEESVVDVSGTSATLRATVNPEGKATTYHFEYDTSGTYVSPEIVPSPAGAAGEGEEAVAIEAHVQNLTPGTTYHFRVTVKDLEGNEAEGEDQSFSTPLPASGLGLPDGRVWELVSPATKDGARILPIEEAGGLVQAAEDGSAITFLSVGPLTSTQEPPAGNANETQVLSIRGGGGDWTSRDIATPHSVTTGISVGHGQEYRFFSPNLSVGVVEPFGSGLTGTEAANAAPLSPGASEKTIYLRANDPLSPESFAQEVAYQEAEAEGGYKPLVTSKSGYADVAEKTKFGGKISFVGATPDAGHVVLLSATPLTTPEGDLYEWAAGKSATDQLQLVSVLPEGEPAAEGSLGNSNGDDVRGAISEDGSRIVWSYNEHLFMRDLSNLQTIQLDAVQGGAGGIHASGAQFQLASSDGTRVFFTDEEELTKNATAEYGKRDLYECDIVEREIGGKPELSCALNDLTTTSSEPANVEGMVLSGSEDSSRLYLVAQGQLTSIGNARGEKAKAGENNLYMLHYNENIQEWEEPAFIAGLSNQDAPDWGGGSSAGNLEKVTSRVSPNGCYFTFMSDLDLTGYDNFDVTENNGKVADEELYLYNACSGHRLVCVSCNPTGERPSGVLDSSSANGGEGLLVDQQGIWRGRWLAGSVPGWTPMRLNTALYQARYLSNSGRVFFDSSDALVPEDTNGRVDVYEYEPLGVGGEGGCEASSSMFSAISGGCVGLISSGFSGDESVFLDASGSGPGGEEAEDVFFLTSAPLAPNDVDTAFDVYDAHECSVSAGCSTEAVAPPLCTTSEACKAAPTPQPTIFGPAGSATFFGAGNVAASPATKIKCPRDKRLTREKCVKKKSKAKKHSKRFKHRPRSAR